MQYFEQKVGEENSWSKLLKERSEIMVKSVKNMFNMVTEQCQLIKIKSNIQNKRRQWKHEKQEGNIFDDVAFENRLSKFHCGGIAGPSTIDRIMTLQAIIMKNKTKRQGTSVGDTEKCFINLWLQDGIKELIKGGINVVDSMMIIQMNQMA